MKYFISAIYAGLMIAFGDAVYVASDNKYAGSFLFSLGLLTVVLRGFDLYTGKIGYLTLAKSDSSVFNVAKAPFYYPIIIIVSFMTFCSFLNIFFQPKIHKIRNRKTC